MPPRCPAIRRNGEDGIRAGTGRQGGGPSQYVGGVRARWHASPTPGRDGAPPDPSWRMGNARRGTPVSCGSPACGGLRGRMRSRPRGPGVSEAHQRALPRVAATCAHPNP
jgi:hypothetical protein